MKKTLIAFDFWIVFFAGNCLPGKNRSSLTFKVTGPKWKGIGGPRKRPGRMALPNQGRSTLIPDHLTLTAAVTEDQIPQIHTRMPQPLGLL